MILRPALLCCAGLALLAPANAAELNVSGSLHLEIRKFTETAQFPAQSNGTDHSWALQPEFRLQLDTSQITFIPFYRDDSLDSERSHGDIRELYYRGYHRQHEWLVGINRVFWGVNESRHLVDIINQTDLVEDPDAEQKLGQPMLYYKRQLSWGNLTAFILPGFRGRTFPGQVGRLRSPLPVATGRAVYQSNNGDDHIDYAARYSHVLGDWDIGLSYFVGTSREPRLLVESASGQFIPYYDLIRQWGLDMQYTTGAWLWKVEAITRKGHGDPFFASVAGFEYTFFQVMDSTLDLGVLFEYLYDGRRADAPPTPFDDDWFVGTRLAFNDTQDTSVLFGVIFDRHSHERFVNLEVQRRLTPHLKAELRARFINHADAASLLGSIRSDDYVQLQLQYHF